jgi:tryptophanyl-tRNA synthetase
MKTETMITGIRPTGDLTVANYLGAVQPLLDIAPAGTAIFVADIHALTDNEPTLVARHRMEIVKDYLALGVDPDRFYIYLQSAIGGETTLCASYLSRLVSVAELLRVPTLKDKLKATAAPETANAALLQYPVLMAADIFLQDASLVPVGQDQVAHLEMARDLARRFNKRYGNTLKEPRQSEINALRIAALKGEGKMSKSNPDGAIFLTDTPADIRKKVKSATTAMPGMRTPELENLLLIASLLTKKDDSSQEAIATLLGRHDSGEKVMGDFKEMLTEILTSFVSGFQERRRSYSDSHVQKILDGGSEKAKETARKMLLKMEIAMGFST